MILHILFGCWSWYVHSIVLEASSSKALWAIQKRFTVHAELPNMNSTLTLCVYEYYECNAAEMLLWRPFYHPWVSNHISLLGQKIDSTHFLRWQLRLMQSSALAEKVPMTRRFTTFVLGFVFPAAESRKPLGLNLQKVGRYHHFNRCAQGSANRGTLSPIWFPILPATLSPSHFVSHFVSDYVSYFVSELFPTLLSTCLPLCLLLCLLFCLLLCPPLCFLLCLSLCFHAESQNVAQTWAPFLLTMNLESSLLLGCKTGLVAAICNLYGSVCFERKNGRDDIERTIKQSVEVQPKINFISYPWPKAPSLFEDLQGPGPTHFSGFSWYFCAAHLPGQSKTILLHESRQTPFCCMSLSWGSPKNM